MAGGETEQATATSLPRIVPGARIVPWDELAGEPHAVVDGPRLPGTVLALSHWPASGSPDEVAADTSAAIVDRYLAMDHGGPAIGVLTNNHFDEDGLLAMWLLVERPLAGPERSLAIAAAAAGDFGTWEDPWAARTALAAMGMAERATTPFPEVMRALAPGTAADPAGALYRALVPRVGPLLRDPERYRRQWEPAWRRVVEDRALLDAGDARIDEVPEADLAVLRAPRPLHPMAVYPLTDRMRVLTATPDGVLVLEHRYETWVRFVSRPLAPRVDLTPLCARLQALERAPGRWVFDGVADMRARLWLSTAAGAPGPSSLGAERLAEELAGHVSSAAPGR
jgi:uncharacterized protein DUF6687